MSVEKFDVFELAKGRNFYDAISNFIWIWQTSSHKELHIHRGAINHIIPIDIGKCKWAPDFIIWSVINSQIFDNVIRSISYISIEINKFDSKTSKQLYINFNYYSRNTNNFQLNFVVLLWMAKENLYSWNQHSRAIALIQTV